MGRQVSPDAATEQTVQQCSPPSSTGAAQWKVSQPTAHPFHHGLQPLRWVLRHCPHAWQAHDQLLLLLLRGQWLLLHAQPAPYLLSPLLEALLFTSGNSNALNPRCFHTGKQHPYSHSSQAGVRHAVQPQAASSLQGPASSTCQMAAARWQHGPTDGDQPVTSTATILSDRCA